MTDSKSSISSTRSKSGEKRPLDLSALSAKEMHYLYLWCLKLTKHHEDAEDLMQQSFIRSLKSHYRGDCKPLTWLCFIARSEFLQILRKSQYRVQMVDVDNLAHLPLADPAESALRKLLREEKTSYAREQLETLPPCMRTTLVLQYFSDLTLKQVAGQTGSTLGAVKSYAHRGKKRLKARFMAMGMGY